MDGIAGNSFTPLATIHLTGPHVLHPEACNPTMDLVALLGLSGNQAGPSRTQGREAKTSISKVALWRMSGSRVWEADLEGQVGGIAWTPDGQSVGRRSSSACLKLKTQDCTCPF